MKKLKRLHAALLLAIAGAAAVLLKENRKLKAEEADLAQELAMLREAVKQAPAAPGRPLAATPAPLPSLDADKFIAELNTALNGSSEESLTELFAHHESRLAAASASQLKELVAWLERNHPLASKERSLAKGAWRLLLGHLAKSDPAAAIAKLGQLASSAGVPSAELLPTLKRMGGDPMRRPYATALQEWLDAALTAGQLDAALPSVAELRSAIAVARGDQSAAVKEIMQLPYSSQREAAIRHAENLRGPEESRRALEELSSGLHYQNFQRFVRAMAAEQGFESAREAVASASLTAEHHDMALAGIAASGMGPDTKERAAWLLQSLRSDDHRALQDFTSQWSQADHTAAATWVNTLPRGLQRDAALRGLIPEAARIDGATAMDWALTVSDPLLRNQLYCEAHEKWSKTDPGRADAYRAAKPLDQEAIMAASRP